MVHQLSGWKGTLIESHGYPDASPARLLEMLADRFGAFEAIAEAMIKLSNHVSENELAVDPRVADALLEFGDDLRAACIRANGWTCTRKKPADD